MKRGLLITLMLMVTSVLVAAGCAPSTGQPSTTTAPMPQLTVFTESSAQVVHPQQTFTLRVKLENRSSVKAESVHVYLEPSATGYSLAEKCNYAMEGLTPAGVKASIGDIFPGENKDLWIECKSTDKAKDEPQNVTFRVFHDFYGLVGRIEDSSITMSFSTGGIVFAPPE